MNNILTLVDRKSRVVKLIKNQSKKTDIVMPAVEKGASELDAKSITFDNEHEFAIPEPHGKKGQSKI